jgi:hypothetical protein
MVERSPRQGYAMLLVIVFIALVNLFLVLSHKQLATAIRVETMRQCTEGRDETMQALAAGLALLQTGTPPASPSQYAFPVMPSTPAAEVVFEYQEDHPEGGQIWLVTATASEVPSGADLPTAFAPPPEPPGPPPPPSPF